MNDTRQCNGREVHPIEDHHTCLKSDLSELISALHQGSYNVPHSTHPMDLRFNHARPIKIQRSRLNDASLRTQYMDASEAFIRDRTVIKQKQRFAKGCVIATVNQVASVRSTVMPKNFSLKTILRDGKKGP